MFNLQAFKFTNLQTLKPSIFEAVELSSKVESVKPSNLQHLKLQTFKLANSDSSFRTPWVSNFQTPTSQNLKLEPGGCSVSPLADFACSPPHVTRTAHVAASNFRAVKLQTRAQFQTRSSQAFEPQKSPSQTRQSLELSKIRVRKTLIVTPTLIRDYADMHSGMQNLRRLV